MPSIVPGISLDSPLSPLFFWIVMTYLIILYFSFDIKELVDKIKEFEKLFLAGAIGTVFYLIFEILNTTLIPPIWSWIENLGIASRQLSFYFDVFLPETHMPFSTFPEFIAVGIFLIAFVYIICIVIFYLLIRVISFCFDPEGKIYPNYRRFQILKKYNFIKLAYSFPYFLLSIGMSFIFLSVFYSFFQYFPPFEWNLLWFLNFVIAGTLLLFSIFLELIFIMIIYDFYCLSFPVLQGFNEMRKQFSKNQNEFKESVWINLYRFFKEADRFFIILIILVFIFIFGIIVKKVLF